MQVVLLPQKSTDEITVGIEGARGTRIISAKLNFDLRGQTPVCSLSFGKIEEDALKAPDIVDALSAIITEALRRAYQIEEAAAASDPQLMLPFLEYQKVPAIE